MSKTLKISVFLIIAALLAVLALLLFKRGSVDQDKSTQICAQVITPARNPQTGEIRDFATPCDVPAGWEKLAPGSRDLATYRDDNRGYELKYPEDVYEVLKLDPKEAYPELNYEKHIASFLDGIRVRTKAGHICQNLEVLVYASGGETLEQWLSENKMVTDGFGQKSEATINGNEFLKYTYPAGDLVPGEMYVAEHSSQIFQINVPADLRGEPHGSECGDVLSTFAYTK